MENQYKINVHSHTIFSDGCNSPLGMALVSQKLGFCATVITDHYYGNGFPDCSLSQLTFSILRRSRSEAKEFLPLIVGIELSIGGEEVLVFGSAAIKEIIDKGESGEMPTVETMLELKSKHDCACILCHPGDPDNWEKLRPILDGFEEINSGTNMFWREKTGERRSFESLEGLPRWCNSDAHGANSLDRAYNLVDTKIETESDLIRYIKKGSQPEFYLKNRDELEPTA